MKTLSPHPVLFTFGEMLRYLRRRARLTQRELSIAVGYSESMISRLEHDERPPDIATLTALFVPALQVADEPAVVAQLLTLAQAARDERTALRSGEEESKPSEPPLTKSLEHYLPTAYHLPHRLTSFVGRDQEVAYVTHLLLQSRLVMLTGPGGCGKTSLAVETARWIADHRMLHEQTQAAYTAPLLFTDGIYLAEFLPLSDPGLLGQTILSALGLEGNPARPSQATLVDFLGNKSVLLLLDNCEHLIDPVARLVEMLLRSCPNLHILATSRERLTLPGEVIFDVPALTFPDLQHLPEPGDLLDFAAVQLFVERCQSIVPDFRLTAENAPAIARICTLLDGIPLALELAAAALSTLSVQEIAARLDARFLLSSPGYRTADARHHTLNDTVAWSYHLLSPPERRFLAHLAVFVGGWTLDALEATWQDAADCVLLLRQLVQKSLVRVEHNPTSMDDRTRYHLLRAVRDYAMARLSEDADEDSVRRCHFTYYARLASGLGSEVFGSRHLYAMARLDADYHNIRAAFRYAADKPDLADACVCAASELSYYWLLRSYTLQAEGISWLQVGLKNESLLTASTRARTYAALLNLHGADPFHFRLNTDHVGGPQLPAMIDSLVETSLAQGDAQAAARLMLAAVNVSPDASVFPEAGDYAQRAWAILAASDDQRGMGFARNALIWTHLVQGDLTAAQALQADNLHFLQQNSVSLALCEAYRLQAHIVYYLGDDHAHTNYLKKVVEVAERGKFTSFIHNAFYILERKGAPGVIEMAEAFLTRQRRGGDLVMLGLALHQLGRMYLNAQQYEPAQRALNEAIVLWRQLGGAQGQGAGLQWSLIDRGQVARFAGEGALALRCFDESIALFAASPYPVGSTFPLLYRGHVYLLHDELDCALDDFRQAISVVTAFGQKGWENLLIREVASVGEIARRANDLLLAGQLFAAAVTADTRSMTPSNKGLLYEVADLQGLFSETADFTRIMAPVPTYRQDPIFAAGWDEGEALSLDAAISLVMAYRNTLT